MRLTCSAFPCDCHIQKVFVNPIPSLRVTALNSLPVRGDGEFVLYWMIANRRATSNFALQHAVHWAKELRRPLVVLEALRVGYQWASDRLHRFVIQGMADNQRAFANSGATYWPYVEPEAGQGAGLVERLAASACVVVTDDFPCFFLPRMLKAVAPRLPVKFEAIDSNGVLPLKAAPQVFPTAYAFRRFLQRDLPNHFCDAPLVDPLREARLPPLTSLPEEIHVRWPRANDAQLAASTSSLALLPIDHNVKPAAFDGGYQAAQRALQLFIDRKLARYEARNEPEEEVTSGLAPYLHFGHVSSHDVFARVIAAEDWRPSQISTKVNGSREGWWGMSPAAEGFLDQLITWRELGYNFCSRRADYDQFESLPAWAQATLDEHLTDERPSVYSLPDFEHARTHDELWNAAQRQLVREGTMHNYLRMLWGKKILEWSPTPREALSTMLELNNKYAVDGRNPNSYSGIFWILGRYDRAWGPERPIFGTIRYMSSQNTARKLNVKGYLSKYGPASRSRGLFD